MGKDKIARFGVSLSSSLLKELDRMIRQKGYKNRSLAISDMVRDHLVEHQQGMTDSEVAGTITLVYDHHRPHVQETLTDLQHKQAATIISSLACISTLIMTTVWKSWLFVGKHPP